MQNHKPSGRCPLVSVHIITYNQVDFIRDTLCSVLSQEYENFEIVVADDGSTDGTSEIIQEYAEKYPGKVVPLVGGVNLGITGNSNRALVACKGEYIAFLGGDDLMLPGKIKAQVMAMENDFSCSLCYHDVELFDSETNQSMGYRNSGTNKKKPFYGKSSYVAQKLVSLGNSFVCAMSVMVRRSSLPPWGFCTKTTIISDWLLWVDVLSRNDGMVIFLPKVLSRYRRHSSNVSNNFIDNAQATEDVFVTLAIISSRYPELLCSVRQFKGYYFYQKGVFKILCGTPMEGRIWLKEGAAQSWYSWKCFGWWLRSFLG